MLLLLVVDDWICEHLAIKFEFLVVALDSKLIRIHGLSFKLEEPPYLELTDLLKSDLKADIGF